MLESQHPSNFQLERAIPVRADVKRIELRSLNIPEYLNRLQIVTRSQNGSLNIDDNHLWAEPLDATLRRVLTENLSSQLRSWQVYDSSNSLTNREAEYTVDIQVFNFEKKSSNLFYFKTLVSISDRNKQTLLREMNEHIYPVSSSEQDYNALVNVMNQSLANYAIKLSNYFQTLENSGS
jgi:uncharacterized lipoprotein YmbA